MNINQMRYFVSLVEHNNFTKAARECVVTQSALSQQVKNLETELKVLLLERNGRTFTLTPAGKLLYKRLIPLLQEISDIESHVSHVGQNMGSTLRLGLLSSMDHHNLATVLKENILNHTGLELSLVYGSHDELYDKFGAGSIHAFISDEPRLTLRDSYSKMPLFANKMYVEFPLTSPVSHQGVKKFKLELSELKHRTLAYVCKAEHLEEERRFLDELFHIKLNLIAVDSMIAGRKLILSSKPKAQGLLFMRSLLRGDYKFDSSLVRYELTENGESVRRALSCYAKPHLHPTDLKEICQIICTIGCKHKDRSTQEESPTEQVKPLHAVRTDKSDTPNPSRLAL